MNTRLARMLGLALLLAVVIAGCQAPPPAEGPTMARISLAAPDEVDQLWATAADVLRAHNLWPDRQDRAAGVMTSFPDTSASFFEFWRPLPTSAFGRAEANLQTVRRKAEVRIEPAADDSPDYNVSVRVDVSRYCSVERQATSSASAFQIFGAKLPTVEGRTESRQASAYWLDLGRDERMESALLDRILNRYGIAGERIATVTDAE
ncbi:MAG: hypothetical protein JXA69_09405 [Phycisphaerae bacterium]|nr:hypothetical protein [Phycisphaerae bacterium]